MKTLYIVDLEKLETRYTAQWAEHLPKLFENRGLSVKVVSGPDNLPKTPTPGMFLDFAATNIYKAQQVAAIAKLFTELKVSEGDHFLFMDAWHPGILNLKYMIDLFGIKAKISALWHAGSYDPHDALGQIIQDKRWSNATEQALFYAIDYNWYATDFHIDMFARNVFYESPEDIKASEVGTMLRTGWPMEYMPELLAPYKNLEKRDLILFPHRIAPEKQPDIFRDLARSMPQYEWVMCQEKQLSKHEYHTLLGQAKMIFSANLQETLGISCYEGALVGAVPLVPDSLSYREMYDKRWKYPSVFVSDMQSYLVFKEALMDRIDKEMSSYDRKSTEQLAESLGREFFSASNLVNQIAEEVQ